MPQGSAPQYRVIVEKDVAMTTRDGVTLRADVYRPDAPGRFPVLLSRLPYNKELRPRPGDIDYFVERGYGVIMQDTRGRFASEGEEYYALSRPSRNQTGISNALHPRSYGLFLDDLPIHIRPDLPAARVQTYRTQWVRAITARP